MYREPTNSEPVMAKVKRHGRFSWVWLIPVVAAGLVAYLAYTTYFNRGPLITLYLSTADGIQAEQTQVKHKSVPLGTVEDVSLSADMSQATVHIRMDSAAKRILTDHARFWVIRPRLSAGSLTGLETIVTGAYIEVDPGEPGGKKQTEFTALTRPPGRQSDEPGHVYVIMAARLGSLSVGAPIYYRDVSVGELLSYDLGDGLGPVTLRVFVHAPYDKFVHAETRFWNASGISVTMGPEGMHLELASLQAILSGGIAFETPRQNENDTPAEDNARFELYADKATADAAFYRLNLPYVTYFETSIQGLANGSPVLLFGVQVGSVTDVKLVYDADKRRMISRVAFDIQPERVLTKKEPKSGTVPDEIRQAFVETDMRVVLDSSSFITGAKHLSILYAPATKKAASPVREGVATVLPSQGGGLDNVTASLSDVATKVDKIPFEQIGKNLNTTLASFQHLADKVDTSATPALAQLPAIAEQLAQAVKKTNDALGEGGYGQNSEFQHGMERLMSQVNDTARSFRVLFDYLDRHPEALLRGRSSKASE